MKIEMTLKERLAMFKSEMLGHKSVAQIEHNLPAITA